MRRYPSRVVTGPTGRSLVATDHLAPGAVVERFEGDLTPGGQVPVHEIRHALVLDGARWLVPTSDARFADHACDPTCTVDDDLQLVTTRTVAAGEALTFVYNVVRPGEDPGPWDPRWSFTCSCGSPRCQGDVDGYVRPWDGGWTRA